MLADMADLRLLVVQVVRMVQLVRREHLDREEVQEVMIVDGAEQEVAEDTMVEVEVEQQEAVGGGSGYIGGVINGTTIAGNASMPSTSGGTETGHSGNGYARITLVE